MMGRTAELLGALDDEERPGAARIAQTLAGIARGFKVGLAFVLDHGLGVVKELGAFGEVVCDFKTADIPHTNGLIARRIFGAGAAGIIVHAFPGEDALRACVTAAGESGGQVYTVVAMTHEGAANHLSPALEPLVRTGLAAGVDGFVAPGNRPELLRRVRELVGTKVILSPGIGTPGGDARSAVAAGADILIVGRTITKAPDPRAAAQELLQGLR